MRLEMRDTDYIWSPARVIAIDKGGTHVICRYDPVYDGWDDTYNESVLWESERLAPLFPLPNMSSVLSILCTNQRAIHESRKWMHCHKERARPQDAFQFVAVCGADLHVSSVCRGSEG